MTVRTWYRLALAAIAVVVVQVGVLQQISLDGVHPDAFLLMAIAAGAVAGPRDGAIVAFCWGILADVFVATPFGLSALCFVLVAAAVAEVAHRSGSTSRAATIVTALWASCLGSLLFAALLVLVGRPHLPLLELAHILLVVAVSNAVLAVPAMAATRYAFSPSGQGVRGFAPVAGTR